MRRRKPGRPPKRPDSISPRDRLLRSARKLFYEKGLATGVDELLAHAKVAKMSLYTHFGSKDALATEYVVDADRSFKQWFDEQMALGPEEPGARLVHTFD